MRLILEILWFIYYKIFLTIVFSRNNYKNRINIIYQFKAIKKLFFFPQNTKLEGTPCKKLISSVLNSELCHLPNNILIMNMFNIKLVVQNKTTKACSSFHESTSNSKCMVVFTKIHYLHAYLSL